MKEVECDFIYSRTAMVRELTISQLDTFFSRQFIRQAIPFDFLTFIVFN